MDRWKQAVDSPERRRRREGYVLQAWLVIALAIAFGGALAGVHILVAPRIAANKENETLEVIPDLVPGAEQQTSARLGSPVVGGDGKEYVVYRAAAGDGQVAGWVILACGQGFADEIELLIGVDASAEKLTGMFVLGQKETPGLGDYITSADKFRDQFRGKPTRPALAVVKEKQTEPQHVRPLTGATISSESVCSIVNQAVSALREPLAALATEAPAPAGS